MYKYYYASTKDRRGHTHNYKLTANETVPVSHEIVNLSVASTFKFSELVSADVAAKMRELANA